MEPVKGWKHPLSNEILYVCARQLASCGLSIDSPPSSHTVLLRCRAPLLGMLGTVAPASAARPAPQVGGITGMIITAATC